MTYLKYNLLMGEFLRSLGVTTVSLDRGQSIICKYGTRECRLEFLGNSVGGSDMGLLVALDSYDKDETEINKINSDYGKTLSGKIIKLKTVGCFYFISFSIPQNTNKLHDIINETLKIVKDITS